MPVIMLYRVFQPGTTAFQTAFELRRSRDALRRFGRDGVEGENGPRVSIEIFSDAMFKSPKALGKQAADGIEPAQWHYSITAPHSAVPHPNHQPSIACVHEKGPDC
jgi:hypothetical protein